VIGLVDVAGFKGVVLENDFIRITVLPEIGGKMIELRNKLTSTQFLLEPQNEKGNYTVPEYGDSYSRFDTSGFDECFPSIASTKVKIEDDEISIPDHGELWSRPWNYRLENDSIILSIKGRIFDYTFEKRISLDGGKVIINYSVLNNTAKGLPYIWSAHPLLKVEPQAEIYLPSSDYKMILDSSSDETIGLPGAELPWPYLKQTTDYSKVQPLEFDKAIKLFEQNPKAGFCCLYNSRKDESILFSFDHQKIKYIGLWLCYGGWPANAEKKHLTVALEPASGCPDDLVKAVKRNSYSFLQPNSRNEWMLEIELLVGKPGFLSGKKQTSKVYSQ